MKNLKDFINESSSVNYAELDDSNHKFYTIYGDKYPVDPSLYKLMDKMIDELGTLYASLEVGLKMKGKTLIINISLSSLGMNDYQQIYVGELPILIKYFSKMPKNYDIKLAASRSSKNKPIRLTWDERLDDGYSQAGVHDFDDIVKLLKKLEKVVDFEAPYLEFQDRSSIVNNAIKDIQIEMDAYNKSRKRNKIMPSTQIKDLIDTDYSKLKSLGVKTILYDNYRIIEQL